MRKVKTYRRNIFLPGEVAWGLFISMITLYAVFRVPADIVLGQAPLFRLPLLDVLLVASFLADPLVGYLTTKARGKAAIQLFLRLTLPVDLICLIPFVLFSPEDPWRMLVVFKLVNVTAFVSNWRQQLLRGGNVVRLALFGYWLMVIIHVTACGWLAIKFDPPLANPEGEYIIATYWSVTTLTTVGYGDITPKTPTEMQFAAMVMLLGFVLMGYLIGNISGLLNRSDPLRAQYAAALEEVSAFATYNGLPADLQHRIVDYFGYMWQQRAAFNESSVLDALPAGIRTEIMLHLKRDVIQEVPFFREASERFIREIANEMRPVVVTPGEHVFHAGDPALHMFFVSRGSLEVIDEAGKPLGHLGEGDFFGEMALLQGRRRMAGVRALDYCDLYKLELHAFERILEAHPGFRDYMKRVATERAELAGVVIDQGDIR